MKSVDQIGVGNERLKGSGVVAVETSSDLILECEEVIEAGPGEAVFESEPDPLARIEFRGIGRLKDEGEIGRQVQVGGVMGASVVEDEHVEGVRAGGGKIIEKGLELLRIEGQACLKIAVAGAWGHDAIDIEVVEVMLVATDGLDPAQRDTATADGVQAKAALIHGPQFEGQGGSLSLTRQGFELLRQRLLERTYGLVVFFGWDGRGTLSPAPSL